MREDQMPSRYMGGLRPVVCSHPPESSARSGSGPGSPGLLARLRERIRYLCTTACVPNRRTCTGRAPPYGITACAIPATSGRSRSSDSPPTSPTNGTCRSKLTGRRCANSLNRPRSPPAPPPTDPTGSAPPPTNSRTRSPSPRRSAHRTHAGAPRRCCRRRRGC